MNMSYEQGKEYIRQELLTNKLFIKETKEATNWSYQRIKSCALTICAGLNGTLVRDQRGVYYLQPNKKKK